MTFPVLFLPLVLLLASSSFADTTPLPVDSSAAPAASIIADSIYYGGDILTMATDAPQYAQAVAVLNGEIIFVGDEKQSLLHQGEETVMVDLEGKTMMPGFIEPHLHPSIAAIMLPNEIIAPYDWVLPDETKIGVQGHDNYINRITASIGENAQNDKVYFIWGYHQLWHGELSRELLNRIAPDQPVAIIHRSFHEIYLNDAAITAIGIQEADFLGNPQVDWEAGHFYEGGWLALVPRMAPNLLDITRYLEGLSIMSELVTQNGITTIAEPGFPSSNFEAEYALLKMEMDKLPPYSVYLIPNGTQLYRMKGGNKEALAFTQGLDEKYNTDNIKFLPNQIKLFSDGAIYSQLMQMQDGYTDGHDGEWMTPPDLLKEQLSLYWDNDYKIHMHSNGDLGIQQVLDFNSADQKRHPRSDHRFTLHHMGYFTDAMAQQVADLNMEASVNPYYLWALADKYSEIGLGAERGENLVRINSLAQKNVPISFHSDFSMAPMEPLTLAWTAVNRVTSQGSKFSQDQRVDLYTALQAITINAARVLNLEGEIGSIEVGKLANFVLLGENPMEIDPIKLKDINVLGTVYRGE
ncbi:MAG: amidohydrolase [Halioglobus sp.]|nr:amidohydrolase [Halioglobus sp.]